MSNADPLMLRPRQTALAQLRSLVSGHAEAIRLACVWEATAPKLGNVHPAAAFEDCTFEDFCAAAAQIAPILAVESTPPGGGHAQRLGQRVLAAITATQTVTRANVNLGIVLLIAPLALARSRCELADVLAGISPEDGATLYRAIQLAGPGGMDSAEVPQQWDLAASPPADLDLIAAMRSASDRDRIARQYASNFSDFFDNVVPLVQAELETEREIGEAIVCAQLRLMADQPDSLILRKCGPQLAEQASQRAAACRGRDGVWDMARRSQLDRWLRQDGNRRNPGTTADLIAAALYWLIR